MKNFNNFVLSKHIDQLAEKCVRENIPIVEFVEWYEEEGQYLPEVWGDIAAGAATGAATGGMFGGLPGAGVGALAGGVYGAGRGLYNAFQKRRADKATASAVKAATPVEPASINDAQSQAVTAINNLAKFAGTHNTSAIGDILNRIKTISSTPPPGASHPWGAPHGY